MAYSWPGNSRHLQNAVEHAVAMSGQAMELTADMLGINFASVMSSMERELILRSLRKANGNKRQAARLLNLSRTTLIAKLHRLGVTDISAA